MIPFRPRWAGRPRATSFTCQTESSVKNSPIAAKSPVPSVSKNRRTTSLGSDILTS